MSRLDPVAYRPVYREILICRTPKFREWQPDASWLFPPSPRDWLPEDHLVYFLLDVTAQIDVSPIVDDYDTGNGGQPPPCRASRERRIRG